MFSALNFAYSKLFALCFGFLMFKPHTCQCQAFAFLKRFSQGIDNVKS